MTREDIFVKAKELYDVEADYPWADDNAVLRHKDNNKWFALFMKVPASKLGLEGEEVMNILNVKCDEILSASLVASDGYFPAYHMSKANWVTLDIDKLPDEEILQMIDFSFSLTEKRKKLKPKKFDKVEEF